MPEAPQKVLNWLHGVLTGEYINIYRTYSDVARALAEYTDLHPSTDVYTFENGHSSLLLHLSGTLPVNFRGSIYAFPVSLWIPHAYPNDTPIAFATPTRDMVIRPGQHVSGEGRLYHPYLAGWRPDRCSIPELVRILQDVFTREPPVIARRSPGESMLRPTNGHIPPPRPPLPPELSRSSSLSQSTQARITSPPQPPPPPPKPFPDQIRSQGFPANGAPPAPRYPPVPMKELSSNSSSEKPLLAKHGITSTSQYQMYKPSEPQAQSISVLTSHQTPPPRAHEQQRREESTRVQASSQSSHSWTNNHQYYSHPSDDFSALGPRAPRTAEHSQSYPRANTGQSGTYSTPPHVSATQSQTQHVASRPPEDLLTSPFDAPLPTHSSENIPAPPIPPNPEKDALLSALSQTLMTQLQSSIASNNAALQPLSAQYNAMTNAHHNLQQEKAALASLQSLLSTNETILHNAMRDADGCVASAQHRSVPGVDEVLVAPTVVGQQLYELVADERACTETREVLGRALDRGRIGSEVWVKKVRELAREEFLKKVLIRKCAEGMGLRVGEDWG